MRRFVEPIAGAVDRACEAGAWAAATCSAVLAAMLFVESVSTAAFAWSQPWAVEYAAYLCAFTLFLGSGYAMRRGAHIRVAALLHYLPAGIARGADLACTLAGVWIAGFLCAGLFELARRSYELDSVSYFAMKTPLWVPQGILTVGIGLLLLALLARALRLIAGLETEEPAGAEPGEDAAE